MPLLVILPEALSKDDPQANLDFITEKVNDTLSLRGRCMVVITEGANVGDVGPLLDAFGHTQFSASRTTAAHLLMRHLNGMDRKDTRGRAHSRLVVPGIARVDVPGTMQRRAIDRASPVDLREAYEVGRNAAEMALAGKSGVMSTIIRRPGESYGVDYGEAPLEEVALAEREFPAEWVAESRVDVTDDFVEWAMPLIGGDLREFVELEDQMAPEEELGDYVPQGLRQ
jgi:6-phosphofructokinase 1